MAMKHQANRRRMIYSLRSAVVLILLVSLMLGQAIYATPSSWSARSVAQLQVLGILSGPLANNNLMQQPITREEFAELAVNLYLYVTGEAFESLSTVNDFTDTTNPYVGAAFRLGIIKGFSETSFSPKSNVTREQIAAMLHREIVLLGLAKEHKAQKPFADAKKISGYAVKSVEFCQYYQLIQGVSGNRFDPAGKATREQVFKIVEGIVTKFKRGIASYPAFTESLGLYKVPKSAATELVLSTAEDRGIMIRIQSGPVQSGNGIDGTQTTDRPVIDIFRQWLEIYDMLAPRWGHEVTMAVLMDMKSQWSVGELRYAGPRVVYLDKNGSLMTARPSGSCIQLAYSGAVTLTVYK